MDYAVNEVRDNRNIDEQHQNSDRSGLADDLVRLEWNERAGDNDGAPLSPAPREPEACSFNQEEPCINEPDGSELPDPILRNLAGSLNGMVEKAASWIETKLQNRAFQHRSNIGVDKVQRSDTRRDEGNRFQQLENGDQPKQTCVGLVHFSRGEYCQLQGDAAHRTCV